MPGTTILNIPHQEQEQRLAALRRSRSSYLLALHIILLCAAGRTPTALAACLFCSRSSGDRTVRLYRAGTLGWTVAPNGALGAPVWTTVLLPWRRRSLRAWLKTSPRVYGWGRTRWSSAALAAQRQGKHGMDGSAWTVRRWLQAMGWVWQRAKLRAKDAEPARMDRLAQMRLQAEHLQAPEMMGCADALDIHLLPKVGAAWMPKGRQAEVRTPGKNDKHYRAGTLSLNTGHVRHCLGPRKNNGLFRDLLTLLEHPYPAPGVKRI